MAVCPGRLPAASAHRGCTVGHLRPRPAGQAACSMRCPRTWILYVPSGPAAPSYRGSRALTGAERFLRCLSRPRSISLSRRRQPHLDDRPVLHIVDRRGYKAHHPAAGGAETQPSSLASEPPPVRCVTDVITCTELSAHLDGCRQM